MFSSRRFFKVNKISLYLFNMFNCFFLVFSSLLASFILVMGLSHSDCREMIIVCGASGYCLVVISYFSHLQMFFSFLSSVFSVLILIKFISALSLFILSANVLSFLLVSHSSYVVLHVYIYSLKTFHP